jgi:hypothetical protein
MLMSMLIVGFSIPALAIAELGVGLMVGDGPLIDVSSPALQLHALLDVACFGIGVDLWVSFINSNFVFFPHVQLQVPLIIAKLYGAIGPKFLGSSAGVSLVPLTTTILTKLGFSLTPLPLVGLYAEAIWSVSPLLMTASAPMFAFGIKLGI